MSATVYQKGKIRITGKIFKTARRTYKIQYIERLQIKRPWFLFSLPLSLGAGFLLGAYSEYLYPIETYLCLFTAGVLPILLYNVGVLSVTSKAYINDTAVIGSTARLANIRQALESVMYDPGDKAMNNCDGNENREETPN